MPSLLPINENYPRMVWAVLRHPVKAWRAWQSVGKLPAYVWVEATNRCNIRCRSCSKFYEPGEPGTDMPLDLFRRILEQIAPHAHRINLTGIGESLFHEHAAEIFDAIREYPHLRIELTSNGVLMDDQWLERFASTPITITFSIDGTDPETLAFNRPRADFDRLVHILQWTRERELASENPGAFPFKRRINFLLMRRNMHQTVEIVEWAAKYGVEWLRLSLLNDWGAPPEFWEEQNPLNYPQDLRRSIDAARRRADELHVELAVPSLPRATNASTVAAQSSRFHLFHPSFASRLGYPLFSNRFCNLPWNAMYFTVDGRASVCCAATGEDFGNAHEKSVERIWNDRCFRMLRFRMALGVHTSYCRMCDLPIGLGRGNPRGNT